MGNSVSHISGNRYHIVLVPKTPLEMGGLQAMNAEDLQLQYHAAVKEKLGDLAILLCIEEDSTEAFAVFGQIAMK
ncbi:hypothetical protein [Parasediminibacterium sp. JCM 36343]|uniref:hypothetical protein n=1 Tax=Parasediminibacterium sp. JCM 36343 TaxID=3374279 RepID=UPI00397C0466